MVDMKKGMHIGQWGVVLGIAAVCIARLAFAESKGSLLTQIGQFQLDLIQKTGLWYTVPHERQALHSDGMVPFPEIRNCGCVLSRCA